MDHKNSQSASYAAAGVDITAGYKAVELMKKHVARTRNAGDGVPYITSEKELNYYGSQEFFLRQLCCRRC